MQLATWIDVIPMLLAIIGALFLPGGLIVVACGRRSPMDVAALGPVVSVTVAGISGIVADWIGISWGWVTYVMSALIVLSTVVVIRSLAGGKWTASAVRPSGVSWRSWLPAVSGVCLSAVTTTVRLVSVVASPDQVTQNYDTVFHDNVVAHIIQTGQATSLHALEPIRDVYPIAFQQFAALGGLAVPSMTAPAAIICAWLVFAAVLWPIGILYLVRSICDVSPVTDFIAPVLAAVAGASPFLLLDWGTLYSMFAGQILLPVLLAVCWQWCLRDWSAGWHRCLGGLCWIVVAGLAVSLAHFRVVMTFCVVALPLVALWVYRFGKMLLNRHGKHFFLLFTGAFSVVVLTILSIGLVVFAKMYLVDSSRPISDRLNGDQALPTDTILGAIGRYLTGTAVDSNGTQLPTDWIIVILLLVGVIGTLICTRGTNRAIGAVLVASFVLLGVIVVSCAGTHADWAKIVTALWYKDQRRPFSAWPVVSIPIICFGLRMIGTRWELHNRNKPQMNSPKLAAAIDNISRFVVCLLAAVSCIASPQMYGMMGTLSTVYAFADNESDAPMLSEDEYLLLKRLNEHVPADEMVISDPWNGSAFMLSVGGRTPFYAHLYMNWDYDHAYLASNFHNIDSDPEVCRIMERNNLHWYLDMGGSFTDPDDPQHVVFQGLVPVPDALEAIDSQGRATLYRITACSAEQKQ